MESFGDYIRRVRKSKGWSLENVAEDLGVSTTTVFSLETDRFLVHPKTFKRLLKLFEEREEQIRVRYALQAAKSACETRGLYDEWKKFEKVLEDYYVRGKRKD